MGLRFFTKLADIDDANLGALLRRGLTALDALFDELSRAVVGARARRVAGDLMVAVEALMAAIGVDKTDPVLGRVFPLLATLGLRGSDVTEEELQDVTRKSLDGAAATTANEVFRPNNECRTYADVLKKTGWHEMDLMLVMAKAQFRGVVSNGTLLDGERIRQVFHWEWLVAAFEEKGFVHAEADEMARALVFCANDCPGCIDSSGCDAVSLFYPYADENVPLPLPPTVN